MTTPKMTLGEAAHNSLRLVRQMIEAGADPNYSEDGLVPLREACTQGHIPIIKYLLAHGADPNGRGQVHGGETPLMTACYFSDINIVEKLLEYPVDVNAKDGKGHNALFYVVAGMCPPREVLPRFKLLYRHGIDLSARDNRGENILQHGVRNDKETRNWLLAHGFKE